MQIIDINGETRECQEISPDQSFPGYMKVLYVSKNRKDHTYSEWYAVSDFIAHNPTLSHLADTAPKPFSEDLGTVSSATPITLKDTTKKWEENLFKNYPVWISRGKGEGQIRNILANTKNTLTIDSPWEITPNKTSQYLISHNVHDPQIMGNILPGENEIINVQKPIKKEKLRS